MVPGSSVKLDILLNGESKVITVTLATMPNEPQKQAKAGEPDSGSVRGVPQPGLSVAPSSDVAGAGNKGVVITAIDPEGPAAEHGLQSGDVILDIGGKSVGTAADLRNALSEAKSGGKHDVLMRVNTAREYALRRRADWLNIRLARVPPQRFSRRSGGPGKEPKQAGMARFAEPLPFVPEAVDLLAAHSPSSLLLAAGGIADGRGLAAALMLGADGVLVGTRLWSLGRSSCARTASPSRRRSKWG